MATERQLGYIKNLDQQVKAAGAAGLTPEQYTRLPGLTNDKVQAVIEHLQTLIPATPGQVNAIIQAHGGIENISPEREQEIRALSKSQAHLIISRRSIQRSQLAPDSSRDRAALLEKQAEAKRRSEELEQRWRAERAAELAAYQAAHAKVTRLPVRQPEPEVLTQETYDELLRGIAL